MAKRNITFLKTQNFIHTYPIVLFFQHNNLSVKQWFQLRVQLKNFENTKILLLKNTIIEKVIHQQNFTKIENIHSLFQGPCFALGLSNFSEIQDVLKIVNQNSNIFLIGGITENQLINHLDIKKIFQLDTQVHESFLAHLQQDKNLYMNLRNPIQNFDVSLNQISLNFLHCLEMIKLKNSGSLNCIHYLIKVNPTAGSPTVTLLRLHSSYRLHYGTPRIFSIDMF